MEEGSLRADVNVSVHKKGTPFGKRTEMKNMSSFRSIVRAIDYEIERQIDVYENGGAIEQETLRWDEVSGKTFSMRSKEDAQDYRYFPEPDLGVIEISEEWKEQIRKTLPEMPEERKIRYIEEFKLPEYDANIIVSSKYLLAHLKSPLPSNIPYEQFLDLDEVAVNNKSPTPAKDNTVLPLPPKPLIKALISCNDSVIKNALVDSE